MSKRKVVNSPKRRQQVKRRMERNNIKVIKNTKVKTPRKKKKEATSIILSVIFFGLFLFYISGYVLTLMDKSTIPNTTVVFGSIDSQEILNGVIVRSETIYNSPTEGVLYYEVSNHARVAKNSLLATIRKDEEIQNIEENIVKLEEDILKTQDKRADFSIFDEDVKKLNRDMKAIVDSGIYKFLGGNSAEIYNIKDNLDKHISIRNQVLLNEDRGSVSNLVQERSVYENMLSENIASINAVEGGILSYSIDGYENNITTENMRNLSRTQTEIDFSAEPAMVNKKVTANDSVFKIVELNEWYIAAFIDNDLIPNWKEGLSTIIYIKNDGNDTFSEQEILIDTMVSGEDESYVVMKATKHMLDYIDNRGINFKVTQGVYQGLKIPITAVVDKTFLKIPASYIQESTDDKFVLKEGTDRNSLVSIVIKEYDETGEFAYVLQDFVSINIGDVILMPDGSLPFRIEDIENSRGVYLLNSGIAEFRKISIDDNTPSNSSHIILDPDKNNNIRAHDKIVSDAKNVDEGQNIF